MSWLYPKHSYSPHCFHTYKSFPVSRRLQYSYHVDPIKFCWNTISFLFKVEISRTKDSDKVLTPSRPHLMLSRLGPFSIPDTTWLNHWQPIRQPILIVRRSLPPKIENKFLWDKIKFSIFNNILQRAQATTQHRTTTTSVVRRPLYNVSVTKTFLETFIKIVQKC